MMYGYDYTSGWGLALMVVLMVAFWGALAWIYFAFRSSGRGSPESLTQQVAAPVPEQLLADRFARGEIDKNEYTVRLAALRGPVRS